MENVIKAKKALIKELKRLSFLEKVNDIDRDLPHEYQTVSDFNVLKNQSDIEKILKDIEKVLQREI